MSNPRSPRRRGAVVALVAALSVAGCHGERPHLAADAETTTTAAGTTSTAVPPGPVRVAQALSRSLQVYADADTTEPERRISVDEATSTPDVPLVFLVRSEGDSRYEVYLPVGPSGSRGWVAKDDVSVASIDLRIEIELGAHRLRVLDAGEVLVDEPIAVGSADRLTPGDVYFLKELLQPPEPDGPYGPYVYGLSGSTTPLSSFSSGTGVVGIHGTDAPDGLGRDVARGCIAVGNEVMTRLVDDIGLPLGTPVDVHA